MDHEWIVRQTSSLLISSLLANLVMVYNRLVIRQNILKFYVMDPALDRAYDTRSQPNYIFICYVISRWPWSDRSMQLLYNRYYVRAASKRAIRRFEREAEKIKRTYYLKIESETARPETREISFHSNRRERGVDFYNNFVFILPFYLSGRLD